MSSSSSIIENVSTWIFKTKTSFHGQELNLPWWFGLACLSYSFSGVIMLLYIPKWLGKSQFPYYSFAYFLIFLQGMWVSEWVRCTTLVSIAGSIVHLTNINHIESNMNSIRIHRMNVIHGSVPLHSTHAFMIKHRHPLNNKFPFWLAGPLSWLADYCNMSNDSIVHVLDRITATPAMGLEVGKLVSMLYHGDDGRLTVILYLSAIFMALYSFGQSQLAQQTVNRDAFVLWHTLWHLYPIVASIIIAMDHHVFSSFVIHCETKPTLGNKIPKKSKVV